MALRLPPKHQKQKKNKKKKKERKKDKKCWQLVGDLKYKLGGKNALFEMGYLLRMKTTQ